MSCIELTQYEERLQSELFSRSTGLVGNRSRDTRALVCDTTDQQSKSMKLTFFFYFDLSMFCFAALNFFHEIYLK